VTTVGIQDMTINGTTLLIGGTKFLPSPYEVHDTLAQRLSATAGRGRMDVWWCGDGLPNVLDKLEFALGYADLGTSADDLTAIAFLERLRTKGGTITFTDWKERRYTYTARSGQQFFYLPRQDSFTAAIAGHTTQATYGLKVWKNDVAIATANIKYQATVTAGDVVPAGEVWVGNATVEHPEAGFKACTPFKFGTANAIYDDILVEVIPLYRVCVVGVPTVPFEINAREGKTLYLAEVA
jgi:hypothetical protein